MRNARAIAVAILCQTVACSGGGGGTTQAPPTVASIAISPAASAIEVGRTEQFSASPRDAAGNVLTTPVTWSSASPSVAAVNGSGLVTGVSVGTTTVTAASGGKQATATILVNPPTVATVAVTLADSSVEQGKTTQATAVLRDAANNVLTRPTTWTSTNSLVASVSSDGFITAAQLGTATITATSEGKSGSATVTVVPRSVNTVVVTLTPNTVAIGGGSQATFVARDVDGLTLSGRTASWSTSNQQIATVNATTGAVTAVAAGQANITATVEGKTGSAQLTVSAVPLLGTVTGLVTANDGATPIADALVEVQGTFMVSSRMVGDDGARKRAHVRTGSRYRPSALVVDGNRTPSLLVAAAVSTRTAVNGTYTLQNVPQGPQVIVATRGAFRATVNVNVQANQSVAAPNAKLTSTGKLAFVRGAFDSIEQIVQGTLGNPMDEIQASSLASSATTSQYRIIFLNCGLDETVLSNPAVVTNLRAFLQAGGTIYASDWAGEFVKALFTDFNFDFTGDAQNTTAAVVDASLQAFLGKSSVSIVYDLDSWTDILALPATAVTLLRGSYTAGGLQRTNQPTAFVIQQGAGRLVFTTFHNEAGATADQIAVLRHFIYLP
jgi:uncharacterized protein YjdB